MPARGSDERPGRSPGRLRDAGGGPRYKIVATGMNEAQVWTDLGFGVTAEAMTVVVN